MRDCDKTKPQLINELAALRQVIARLEKSDAERHRAILAIQEAYEYAEGVVDAVREPLVVLDGKLRMVSANHSFCKTFQVTLEEIEGQLFFRLMNHRWHISKLRKLLKDILVNNTTFDDFKVEHHFPGIGHRTMLLNARRICRGANKARFILLAIEDITECGQTRRAAQEEQAYFADKEESAFEPLVVLDAHLRVAGRDN